MSFSHLAKRMNNEQEVYKCDFSTIEVSLRVRKFIITIPIIILKKIEQSFLYNKRKE